MATKELHFYLRTLLKLGYVLKCQPLNVLYLKKSIEFQFTFGE